MTSPLPAPPPKPDVAGAGWRIQLGAFSQRGFAEALFKKLSASLAGHQPFFVQAGPVTRLQVGPYASRAAAAAACRGLRGQPCFPVPGK
jgi:cell division septation protein DedD